MIILIIYSAFLLVCWRGPTIKCLQQRKNVNQVLWKKKLWKWI